MLTNDVFYSQLKSMFGSRKDAPTAKPAASVDDLPPGFEAIYSEIMSGNTHVKKAFDDLLMAKAEHQASCVAWANAVELFELQTDLPLPRQQRKSHRLERDDHADTVNLQFRDRTIRLEKASVEEIAQVAANAALGKLPTAKQLRAMPDDHPTKRDIATKGELFRRFPDENAGYRKHFALALSAGLI